MDFAAKTSTNKIEVYINNTGNNLEREPCIYTRIVHVVLLITDRNGENDFLLSELIKGATQIPIKPAQHSHISLALKQPTLSQHLYSTHTNKHYYNINLLFCPAHTQANTGRAFLPHSHKQTRHIFPKLTQANTRI